MKTAYGKMRKVTKHFHDAELTGISLYYNQVTSQLKAAKALNCEGVIIAGLDNSNPKDQKELLDSQWEEVSAEQVELEMIHPALYQALSDFQSKNTTKAKKPRTK